MWFFRLLIFVLLFLLPFFPKQEDPWIRYLIGALAVSILPLFPWRQIRRAEAILFLLFLFFGLVSCLFSQDRQTSFIQLALYGSCFIIFLVSSRLFPDREAKENLALVLVLVSVLLSAVALYHTLILHYVNRGFEETGFLWIYFGHNHLSALLIFTIPLTFYFLKTYWQQRWPRFFLLFAICYLLFALFLTFARASMISLLLAVLFVLVVFRPGSKKLLFLLSVLVLAAIFVFNNPFYLQKTKDFGLRRKQGISYQMRLIYARQALENFQKYPFTGSGLNTFKLVNYQSKEKGFLRTYYTHNFFLQILSDTGIFGFLTGLGLIFSVLWRGFRRRRNFLLAAFWTGLLASTLNSLVDYDWQLPTVFFLFWLIAGLFYDYSRS